MSLYRLLLSEKFLAWKKNEFAVCQGFGKACPTAPKKVEAAESQANLQCGSAGQLACRVECRILCSTELSCPELPTLAKLHFLFPMFELHLRLNLRLHAQFTVFQITSFLRDLIASCTYRLADGTYSVINIDLSPDARASQGTNQSVTHNTHLAPSSSQPLNFIRSKQLVTT